MNKPTKPPFEIKDVEDVRIIIKAKGKHFSIVPKKNKVKEAEIQRLACLYIVMESHDVLDKPLEEFKDEDKKD